MSTGHKSNKFETYFRHDCHAFDDPKIKRLRHKFGIEGYGIYWYLVEQMACEMSPYSIDVDEEAITILACDMSLDADLLAQMIAYCCEIRLFNKHEGRLTSASLQRRMQSRDDFLIRQSENGMRGAKKRWENDIRIRSLATWHDHKPDWFNRYVHEFREAFPKHAKAYLSGEGLERELYFAVLLDSEPQLDVAHQVVEGAAQYAIYLSNCSEKDLMFEAKPALKWIKDRGWTNTYKSTIRIGKSAAPPPEFEEAKPLIQLNQLEEVE